ncbi:precorrin-2 C(20)-methyltransferase [Blautia sp. HCP3S3_H10_1]|uniref:precorrin-2 C(20)-methyltransferase n=1 Tax=unclassified Blautia TaxID=2648079 RepID=UPI003F906E37|nr:precorrin-2 C(20)-methyltransferase [Clostridia bacterium]
MTGKLYGVGVGPGDPELVTLKALRLTKEADILAFPGENPKESVAYKIMKGAYPEIDSKQMISLPMPMIKEKEALKRVHDEGARIIAEWLEKGKNVVFLTLGDPTVYSTYIYVHKRVEQLGYATEIVSGITSFCAVSARLNEGLVEKSQQLHVIPASYQVEEALKLPGTKVLMKAGKKMQEVKAQIKASGNKAVMIENCGMPDEKIYRSVEEIPENAGYYSLIIVKDEK